MNNDNVEWSILVECSLTLELVLKIFGAVISILSLILGLFAMNTWRKQIKYKAVYENALQLEAAVTNFIMYSCGEASIKGQKKLNGCHDDIVSSYFLLLQRGFMEDEVKELYAAFNECVDNFRDTGSGVVLKENHENLLSKLNIFSLSLRKRF